jgi:cholesterol oxidase
MKKLSKSLSELKSHYDFIVIGSGYGGSIAASRMSRLGKSVCLLEKGKEFLPGQFPKTLKEAALEMNMKRGKNADRRNGLYEFNFGKGINVFKGCGLGGTSLVNANVSIKPESRVMEQKEWPTAIREDLGSFEDGLQRAWDMLQPNPYPENENGYPVLKKTEAMRKSAERMAEDFRLLDINVTFEDRKDNHVGVHQPKCTNCGDCVTGCNVGAKNTTAMNYLPDAFNHGADIFTEINVRYVEKSNGFWKVFFNPLNTGREVFDAPEMFVFADNVILSAGSLGSTEILFRSAQKGLKVSSMLGKRFTGNGDVLGFGYNNDVQINGIGLGRRGNGQIAEVGPCITSVIDMRKGPVLENGMTLEEGTVPGPIRGIMPGTLLTFSRLFGLNKDRIFSDSFFNRKWREIVSMVRGPFHGAINHTQIYLVMTHDDGNGNMVFDNDQLQINWKGVGKQEIFKKVEDKLLSATRALGGTNVPNPTWNKKMDYELVTVHPLGGCAMADHAGLGVTDHKGQVFSSSTGTDLHKGLYVMDGAVIPRPVGTNPLLTISALAERSCKLIAEEMGMELDYGFNINLEKDALPDIKAGVQFTETMKGFLSLEETEDYDKGFEKGKASNSPFEFTLTIRSEDVETFVGVSTHEAGMYGTMLAPALSEEPLSAVQGTFNLFIENSLDPERKKMLYNAVILSNEGKKYYFRGFKDVYNNKGFDVWKDTTTLFITVFEGESAEGKIIGKGKLIIHPADFAKQLTTMKALNTSNKMQEIWAITTFGKFFGGNVFETYFKRLGKRE